MTRGRELPVNSKVRRRLFSEDEPAPKKKPEEWKGEDYLSRIIKTEYIARNLKNEVILKGMKWNFDFENEVAMDGPIQWYKKGNTGEWAGMKPSGRTITMRKRNKDPGNAYKSSYENERRKVRKLSPHTVVKRREFFNDGRALENARTQGEDDNFTNVFMDDTPPIYRGGIHWNFDYDNRVPLEGPVNWHLVGEDWVGHRPGLPTSIIIYPHYEPQLADDDNSNTSSDTSLSSESSSSSDSSVDSDSDSDSDRTTKPEKELKPENTQIKEELLDAIKEMENDMEVIDDLNNDVTGNVEEANVESDIVQETKKVETIEVGKNENDNKGEPSIPKDNFESLKITENITDMEVQMGPKENQNDIKETNEVTPKNQNNGPVLPVRKLSKAQVKRERAKRRLFNYDY